MPTKPDVSPNLELINRAEVLIRDEPESEARDVIERLLVALMGRETQIALMYALIKETDSPSPTEHYRNQYRVTYPRTRSAAEPRDTRVFEKSEEMLDLALYCKQSAPEFADHVVMEHRALFAGPWKRL